jgi:N-acyl-L-homoserine lactone synthetase
MSRTIRSLNRVPSLVLGPYRVEYASGGGPRTDEYRLRYSVFVEERHWKAAGAAAGRLEQDEFDAACCAFLLRDSRSGEAAACQRFILPERLPSGLVTNVERVASDLAVDFGALPRDSWAEVSRSTIAPKYRWGSSATPLPAMVAIKYASIALALALKRRTLFSFSDPRTARLTRRLGFNLHQVGHAVEFHGTRAAFRIDIAEVLASVPPVMQDTLARLVAGAAETIAPGP